jgi:hypothetical protein
MLTTLPLYLFLNLLTNSNTPVIPGYYDDMLIAYNPANEMITGYFESATGFDEETRSPRFTCIFYLEGRLENNEASLKTYYPADTSGDLIVGSIKVNAENSISIKLPEEHGGCWNVFHFADSAVNFRLTTPEKWLEIRFVEARKTYFYSSSNENARSDSYLVRGDVVRIDSIANEWVHGIFVGNKETKGWLKTEALNKF